MCSNKIGNNQQASFKHFFYLSEEWFNKYHVNLSQWFPKINYQLYLQTQHKPVKFV